MKQSDISWRKRQRVETGGHNCIAREEECHHGVETKKQPAKQGRERKEWREGGKTMRLSRNLKVPKREISDRSDFPHFYTI